MALVLPGPLRKVLPTLSDADVGRLLDGLVAGLPSDVRDQLVARSEGIPVFAVETAVAAMIEQGQSQEVSEEQELV